MKAFRIALLAALLVPAMALAADPAKAMIVTSGEKPAECISAVHINRIDDREVKVQKLGFELDPGTHSLSGRANVNVSFCNAVGPGTDRNKLEPLTAEFEAGKTYHVGYDHSSPHRKDWKLVIWKIEDSGQG